MDGIFSVNNQKPNHFTFDIDIEGLDKKEVECRFVIKYRPDFHLTFPCVHNDNNNWSVEIPPLPMLERTSYNYCIEVVIDGYYFEGAKGLFNVVGTPEIYVHNVEFTTDKRPEKREVDDIFKQQPKPVYTKQREKPIEQIAKELTSSKTPSVSENQKSKSPVLNENKDKVSTDNTKETNDRIPEKKIDFDKIDVNKIINETKTVKSSEPVKKSKVLVKKGRKIVH